MITQTKYYNQHKQILLSIVFHKLIIASVLFLLSCYVFCLALVNIHIKYCLLKMGTNLNNDI